MTIKKELNGTTLTIAPEGHLDTLTARELEAELKNSSEGVERLVLDLEKLDYISSAGLRVLLLAHKSMLRKDGMKVKNISALVREVFEVTGFCDILDIE